MHTGILTVTRCAGFTETYIRSVLPAEHRIIGVKHLERRAERELMQAIGYASIPLVSN